MGTIATPADNSPLDSDWILEAPRRTGDPLPPATASSGEDTALAVTARSLFSQDLWAQGYFPERLHRELTWDQVQRLLLWTAARRASDVAIRDGEPCWMQVDGVWHKCTETPFTDHEVQHVINASSGQNGKAGHVLAGRPDDYAFSVRLPGSGLCGRRRFRANATRTGGTGLHLALRVLPDSIPTLGDMEDLDPGLVRRLYPSSGLVLVSGVMGSGKSTLLAAVLHRALTGGLGRQVLTLEQPVEFDFRLLPPERRQAPVAQSAVGEDVPDWPSGVRTLTRRKGEIVMIGECRDGETAEALLTAAEQGVTAYTTVHARSVPETVSRLVNAVREERRQASACVLASTLKLVIHQRLVPCLRTAEEIRAGMPRRIALREHLALDERARRLLFRTPSGDVVPVLRRLVERQGRSLATDALAKLRQGRISAATCEAVLAEYEAGGEADQGDGLEDRSGRTDAAPAAPEGAPAGQGAGSAQLPSAGSAGAKAQEKPGMAPGTAAPASGTAYRPWEGQAPGTRGLRQASARSARP